MAFRHWAGEGWKGTYRQWNALNREAENVGFNFPDVYRMKYERKDILNVDAFLVINFSDSCGSPSFENSRIKFNCNIQQLVPRS